jgi:hypothetical protein
MLTSKLASILLLMLAVASTTDLAVHLVIFIRPRPEQAGIPLLVHEEVRAVHLG